MCSRRQFLGLCAALTAVACEDPSPPGDLVGRYRVTGTLAGDSCGPGLGASPSFMFQAELRRDTDADTAYWLYSDQAPTRGTLDDDGRFLFRQQSAFGLLDPQPETGYAGCRIAQIQTVNGVVSPQETSDAGVVKAATLQATNVIDFAPIDGDDCRPAIAINGGPWLGLPCRVQYTLTGTFIDSTP